MRPFFGSHSRTSHFQIKVRTHTCAHTQSEVVALRTRTRTSGNFSIFFHQIFKLFPAIFQHFYGLVCSKTEKDVLNQNKMIQNRKGCSKAGKDVQKRSIFWQFCPKKCAKRCKSAIAHRTPIKGPHARTSRTLSRMDFARTCTRATAHRTCACAHAPSQLIPCILYTYSK